MSFVCVDGDTMDGHVPHHAGHQIAPGVDCPGHSVTGVVSGSGFMTVNGVNVVVVGDEGNSNCQCDGLGFTTDTGSVFFTINGVPVVLGEQEVDIHGVSRGVLHATNNSFMRVGG